VGKTMSGAAAPQQRLVGVRELDHLRAKLDVLADKIIALNGDYLGMDEIAALLLTQAAELLVRARVRLHAQALMMEMEMLDDGDNQSNRGER